jgi:zinc finger-containing ubiquitin peptidase 1
MPSWLRKQLETGAKPNDGNKTCEEECVIPVEQKANETSGIVPVLGILCEQEQTLSNVYLSHPDVQHIVKMAREGGFCGYRNIQMMISFIRGAKSYGYQHFMRSIPSVLELQDAIERAWDRGINDFGRIETGGIKGTRKFIGTSEVCNQGKH